MNEERVSNIAQASFLVGAGLYIGYSLTRLIVETLATFITL